MKRIAMIICLLAISCAHTGNIPKEHGETCPGITDASSEERKKAVLFCEDKHVLFDVARFDDDSNVRIVAIKHILDIKMIMKLYKFVKTDDALSKSEKKKFRKYLKKKFELLKKCPGVGYSDVEKRRSAISKCDSNLVKVFVAKYDLIDEVRLFAASNITSIELLKELWQFIKNDKSLSLKMKKRFKKVMKGRTIALSKMLDSKNTKPKESPKHSSGSNSSINFDENGKPKEVEIITPQKKKEKKKKKRPNDFTDDEVDIVVRVASARIKSCYEQLLRKDPTVQGKIKIRISIDKNGKGKKVKFIKDEINYFSFRGCIERGIEGNRFHGVTGPGSEEWPIFLTPSN